MKFGSTILAFGCLTLAENIADSEEFDYDAAAEYLWYGDCLGLAPMLWGQPGPYVTSDIQFAQQMVDLLRAYYKDRQPGDEELNEAIAMRIGSRFFVDEPLDINREVVHEMIATSLYVELEENFKDLLGAFAMDFTAAN